MGRVMFWRLLLGLALVMIPQPALRAEWAPTFGAAGSSWIATDIVVVQDGVVQSVWKGDLKVGERFPMEEFKRLTNDPRVYYGFGRKQLDPNQLPPGVVNAVKKVSGKRLVLFLVRDDGKPPRWMPAAENFAVSAVWIENGQGYSVQQIRSSGPTLIRPMWQRRGQQSGIISEAELKAEVETHCRNQTKFTAVERIEDPTERAKALVKFLLASDSPSLGYRAYESLTKCGEPAWKVIRPLLFEEQHLAIHTKLMHVGIQLDPKVIVPEMERIVAQETEHWRTIPQESAKDLYRKPPLSHHFERLESALWALKRAEYDDSKNIVASLRKFWDSSDALRVLGSQRGETVSPILKYADEILGNPPAPLKLPDEEQHSVKQITEIADKAVEDLIPRGDYLLAVSAAGMMLFRHPRLTKYPEYQAALDEQLGRIRDALREATGDRHPEVWKAWNRNVDATINVLRPKE